MPLGSFYAPPKALKTQCFSDIFRGYKKRPVVWNRFMKTARWKNHCFLNTNRCLYIKYIKKINDIYVQIIRDYKKAFMLEMTLSKII